MLVSAYKTNQMYLKSQSFEHEREPMVSSQEAFKPMVFIEDLNFKNGGEKLEDDQRDGYYSKTKFNVYLKAISKTIILVEKLGIQSN